MAPDLDRKMLVDDHDRRRQQPVPMKDDAVFGPSSRVFPSHGGGAIERPSWLWILRKGLLTLVALVIGWAVLLLADPAPRLKAVMASLVGTPAAPAADAIAAAPRAQSTADAQASLPAENEVQNVQPDAPDQPQAQGTERPAEDRSVLIRQFQSWANQQDSKPEAPSEAAPAAKAPVAAARSAAPARALDSDPGAARAAQKPRPAREPRNARAEIEAARRAQAKAAHAPSAPARPQAVEDPRPPEEPAQAAQPPSLLQMFGLHN
jgi:hypothetical protein